MADETQRPPLTEEKLKEMIRKADPDRADAITLLVRRNRQQAATIDGLRGLLRNLVERLDFVIADPAYKSVWTISQIHVGPYRGPSYAAELDAARAALAAAAQETKP